MRTLAAHSISSVAVDAAVAPALQRAAAAQQRHPRRRQRQPGRAGRSRRRGTGSVASAIAAVLLRRPRLTDESISPEGHRPSCAPPPSSSPPRLTRLATSRRPTGSSARPPPTARSSSCCPRSGACSAAARTCAPAPQPLDGAADHLGARRRARARHRPRRRLGRRARRRASRSCATRRVHVGPDGEIRATYRKIHLFDVEVDGTVYRESDHEEPGDEPVLTQTADGIAARPERLLRRALPRALPRARASRARGSSPSRPRSRCRRRATTGRSCCAPARSRTSASSSPPTRSASTSPAFASGGRSMIVDPWGARARAGPRRARP